jgi:hypothetical protein
LPICLILINKTTFLTKFDKNTIKIGFFTCRPYFFALKIHSVSKVQATSVPLFINCLLNLNLP